MAFVVATDKNSNTVHVIYYAFRFIEDKASWQAGKHDIECKRDSNAGERLYVPSLSLKDP